MRGRHQNTEQPKIQSAQLHPTKSIPRLPARVERNKGVDVGKAVRFSGSRWSGLAPVIVDCAALDRSGFGLLGRRHGLTGAEGG